MLIFDFILLLAQGLQPQSGGRPGFAIHRHNKESSMQQFNINILSFYSTQTTLSSHGAQVQNLNSSSCCTDGLGFQNVFQGVMGLNQAEPSKDSLPTTIAELYSSIRSLLDTVQEHIADINRKHGFGEVRGTLTVADHGKIELISDGRKGKNHALIFILTERKGFNNTVDRLQKEYTMFKFIDRDKELAAMFHRQPVEFTIKFK